VTSTRTSTTCNLHIKLLLLDERVEGYPVADWLPEYVQEELWTVLYYEIEYGHIPGRRERDQAPWVVEALENSPAYPEGWLPRNRRTS